MSERDIYNDLAWWVGYIPVMAYPLIWSFTQTEEFLGDTSSEIWATVISVLFYLHIYAGIHLWHLRNLTKNQQ